MEYQVMVELPTDTQDECCKDEPCQFLVYDYCALFRRVVVRHNGHTYKLRECPASGEKRYDE